MYGIKQNRDRTAIAQMVSQVVVPHFEPKSGVRIDVNDAEAQARGNDGSVGWYIYNPIHVFTKINDYGKLFLHLLSPWLTVNDLIRLMLMHTFF
jgi:hypothetical protein